MPEHLRIGEAAEFLGVSKETLRNWDRSGKLVAERDTSNNYRIYSLDKLMEVKAEGEDSNLETDENGQKNLFVEKEADTPSRQYLKQLVWKMSSAFRDSLGGGLLERFEEITKLLFCKLHDEEKLTEEQKFFRGGESPDVVYERISQLYEEAYNRLPERFNGENDSLGQDKVAIAKVVEILEDVSLRKVPADVKGVVFEELVRDTFEKGENQQFFTPRQVVEAMVAMLEPSINDVICDPGCGTGGFLIKASEYRGKDEEEGSSGDLIGVEIDRRMAWVAQMNLVMHGDGSGTVYRLSGGGSLSRTEMEGKVGQESVDIILTNPPFGSEVTRGEILNQYELGRGRESRRRGILFIERCIELLKPGGKAGIVIEDSVLNGASNGDVREYILDNSCLEAVISLPEETFMPYATAETSILVLRKPKEENVQEDVFMADVEKVGKKSNGDPDYRLSDPTADQPELDSELPEVTEAWQAYQANGKSAIQELRPKVFSCPSHRFEFKNGERKENRLDVQYHHPSRNTAEKILGRSVYPLHKLAELVVFRSESVTPNDEDPKGVWRYMGLGDIESETGRYQVRTVLGREVKSTVRLFKGGDIVFSKMRPNLRKCVLIDPDEEKGYASAECYVMRTPEEAMSDPSLRESATKRQALLDHSVDPHYIALMLRSDVVYGQLVYQVTGMGRPRVNKSTIMNLKIPLPPEDIQKDIVEKHKNAQERHTKYMEEAEELRHKAESSLNEAREYAVDTICPKKN